MPQPIAITDDAAFVPAATAAPGARPVTIDDEAGFQPTIGRGEAAAHTFSQGGTLGFGDELRGLGGVAGEALSAVINQGRLPTKAELRAAYAGQRDDERRSVAEAREAYPVQSFATEVAGGLLVPVPGVGAAKAAATGVRATGLGARALQAAKALAPAAAAGAVAGVGYQEGGEGQIADAGEVARDAVGGAVTGAAVAGGLRGAGKLVRRLLPKRDVETIKAGIVDQLSQAEGGPRATPTAQKRVSKAADAILDEMVKGPDGELVHEIIQSPSAQKGLARLEPLLDRVEAEKQTHYDRFARASVKGPRGRFIRADHVDVPSDVGDRLQVAERSFRREGDSRMADGLAAIRTKLVGDAKLVVDAGDKTDLRWLRKQVTSMQDAAASTLGSLNEHLRARTARRIAGEAKDVLDQVIDARATGRNDLAGAAAAIRRLNRRQFALLSIQDVLENRADREAAKGGPLERVVNQVTGLKAGPLGVAGAAVGAAAGGAPLAAIGTGAALLPAAARKADRWLNARAITQLREAATGQGPGPSAVIRSLATELQIPERQVRAAYLRLIVGGRAEEARAE